MAKAPVSPTRSKTSEITMFHVTMMTTIPVHRLGTPRESQITPIIQEFKATTEPKYCNFLWTGTMAF